MHLFSTLTTTRKWGHTGLITCLPSYMYVIGGIGDVTTLPMLEQYRLPYTEQGILSCPDLCFVFRVRTF